ncbi:hypothetical protein DXG01_013770 [Tephrocybe rancida]|nr:hypothetical protein DXG01_013770 [Tephrocybe rancida]
MGDFDRTIVNTYISGVVILQFASYCNTRIRDPSYIKCLAGLLFLINTFHCAVAIYTAWKYCVDNYVAPDALAVGFWGNSVTPICIAITGLMAHVFLTYRFYRLTNNIIAFGVFTVVSVAVFALAMSVGVMGLTNGLTLRDLYGQPVFQQLVRGWLILQTLLEAGLTVRGAIQSGFVVFVFSFADLIASAAGRTTTVFALFSTPIAPLYSALVFDTLLSRRVSLGSPDINSMPGTDSTGIWIPNLPKVTTGSGVNQSINLRSIHVRTEVDVKSDPEGRRTPVKHSLDIEYESRDELDRKTPNVI